MKGHEYARGVILDLLADTVPAYLTAHLAAIEADWPVPADVDFLMVDDFSMVDAFPVVIVRSTDGPQMTADGGDGFLIRYEIEIVVASDVREHGDYEAASRGRDRLLLAVREAVLNLAGLPDDVDVVIRGLNEATGAAADTLSGRPIAAGSMSFPVIVHEDLTRLDLPEVVENVDLTVAGYPASTQLED